LENNYSSASYYSKFYNFPAFPSQAPQLFADDGWLSNDPWGSKPADKLGNPEAGTGMDGVVALSWLCQSSYWRNLPDAYSAEHDGECGAGAGHAGRGGCQCRQADRGHLQEMAGSRLCRQWRLNRLLSNPAGRPGCTTRAGLRQTVPVRIASVGTDQVKGIEHVRAYFARTGETLRSNQGSRRR